MRDYATDLEMDVIGRIYQEEGGDEGRIVARVQALVDKDKECLRLMLIHEEAFKRAVDMIVERHKDVLTDPRMGDNYEESAE